MVKKQNKPDKDNQPIQDDHLNSGSDVHEQNENILSRVASVEDELSVFDSPFLSKEAKSKINKIDELESERQSKRDQNIIIGGLLKKKSTYSKTTNNSIEVPTPAQKKVLRLTKKANMAFDVAITAQIEMEKSNLANWVKQDSKSLESQMLNDRINSPYFLKKNKGHVKKSVSRILEVHKNKEPRAFSELKSLSTQRSKNGKKQFESGVLELVKYGGDKLYKKFTATLKFKEELMDYVREKITTL